MKQKLVDPIPCFIPIWTSAISFAQLHNLKKGEDSMSMSSYIHKKFKMNYGDCKSCLVGEAHQQLGKGTENSYSNIMGSDSCNRCGNMCGDQALNAVNKGGDTLIKFKVKLYNHMVEKHGFSGNIIDITKVQKAGQCS